MQGLQALLSQADRALGRLDGSVLTLPNPDLFVFMYIRKEAVLSSQIEGTQGSLQDVLAAEAKIFNCNSGVLHKPVLYLLHYFKRYHQTYYDRLQAIRDLGAWEDWLWFFLQGVVEVSEQATETARRILRMREEHRNDITEKLGYAAGNGHRILETLYAKPIVSVKDVEAVTGTTFAAANQLVKRLEEMGLLEEITGQARNRRFHYAPYIRLFADHQGVAPEPLK
ncbi:MAG: MarR family transcriptional regulator [Candidatus Thiosymbion ectosymbiont of Robbea hypermnestra]|nr:MarR family transcriptional regulator [Candidatus Thiosymbion ectosymbiont of Robbea hypermnestra]